MTTPTPHPVDLAIDALERGDDRKAISLLEAFVSTHPKDDDALQLLGALCLRLGEDAAAEAWLRRAYALNPSTTATLLNLAHLSAKKRDAQAALDFASQALNSDQGNLKTALEALKVFTKTPLPLQAAQLAFALGERGHRDAQLQLEGARHAAQARQAQMADAMLKRADAFGADRGALYHAEADVAWALGTLQRAVTAARNWQAAAPNDEAPREALARALFELGDTAEAAEVYRPLIQSAEDLSPARSLVFGRMCLHTQEFETARHHLEAAAKGLPDNADVLVAQARLETFAGNLEAAEGLCRRALSLAPTHARGYAQLSTTLRGALQPEDISAIETLKDDQSLDSSMRAALHFALGDAAFRQKDAERALHFYTQGNDQRRDIAATQHRSFVYDASVATAELARCRAAADGLEAWDGAEEATPTFIVGLPRSGTTLFERIITKETALVPGGELTGGPMVQHALLLGDAGRSAGEHRQTYLDARPDRLCNIALFTDKMPKNGAIMLVLAKLFPTSRFVVTARDPFDTAISIFRHQFPNAYSWAHRLDDIADYIPRYLQSLFAQQAALPERATIVDYDHLVRNKDEGTAKLLAAAGVAPNTGSAPTEESDYVATFSSVQVRAPIDAKSADGGSILRPLMPDIVARLEEAVSKIRSDMERVP